MILIHQHGFRSPIVVQRRMSHYGIHYRVINVFAVFVDLADGGPDHIVFVHIVPEHFIDADFKDGFEVSIDRFGEDSSNAEFIDVEAGCVAIVEDLGVTKSMDRGPFICFGVLHIWAMKKCFRIMFD